MTKSKARQVKQYQKPLHIVFETTYNGFFRVYLFFIFEHLIQPYFFRRLTQIRIPATITTIGTMITRTIPPKIVNS